MGLFYMSHQFGREGQSGKFLRFYLDVLSERKKSAMTLMGELNHLGLTVSSRATLGS